jgi:hypothetical protein
MKPTPAQVKVLFSAWKNGRNALREAMRLNALLTRGSGDTGISMIDECAWRPGEDLDEKSPLLGIRVLITHLSPRVADVCAMILNLSGLSAFAAHSVSQAVELARANALDVAFIELLIGETNGIDAAIRILEVRPHCRIVIWTDQGEPLLSWVRREADGQFGGCDLLLQPVHPSYIIHIARGEGIPPEFTIPSDSGNVIRAPWLDEEYLIGSELHEYLSRARTVVLKLMEETDRGRQ